MKYEDLKHIMNDELLFYYATLLGDENTSEEEFKKVETEILARMTVSQSILVNNLCTNEAEFVK